MTGSLPDGRNLLEEQDFHPIGIELKTSFLQAKAAGTIGNHRLTNPIFVNLWLPIMALADLDELIAEVDRTCPTVDWVERLRVAGELAAKLRALGDDLVTEFVEHARFHNRPWAEIGTALGVTRQAAQQRFLAPHKEYPSSDFSEELQVAMPAIKQVAVAHRHNYIGTEHVLLGITTEENSATRGLESLGVSVADLRRALEDRMTLGASAAAERIAFTPYARKVVAFAQEIATGHGVSTIACVDVLAGLVRLGRGFAAQYLRGLGVSEEGLDQLLPETREG